LAAVQPAFWLMGNLGRAGYMASTAGMWPWSYGACEGSGAQPWSGLDPQLVNACPGDPPGVNRAAWGLNPQQGRGAPEFDVFEVANTPGGAQPPHASQTLQMAPLMPEGTAWWSGPADGGVQYPGGGPPPPPPALGRSAPPFLDPRCPAARPTGLALSCLGAGAGTAFATRRNPWTGSLGRPGNEFQDSISALSDLGPSYYTSYHTYGVDWRPGQVCVRVWLCACGERG
jgi:hypothetical protein